MEASRESTLGPQRNRTGAAVEGTVLSCLVSSATHQVHSVMDILAALTATEVSALQCVLEDLCGLHKELQNATHGVRRILDRVTMCAVGKSVTTRAEDESSGVVRGGESAGSGCGDAETVAHGTLVQMESALSGLRTLEVALRHDCGRTQVPSLKQLSHTVDKLQSLTDRIAPPLFQGGGHGRFEFVVDSSVDPGQPNFFGSAPPSESLDAAIRRVDLGAYCVCGVCDRGVHKTDVAKHSLEEHGSASTGTTCAMSHDWVIAQCGKFGIAEDKRSLFVYTLETPICYDGNWAMRSVVGDGRDPFKETVPGDRPFVDVHWAFQKLLHEQLNALPNLTTTAYRAVRFNVSQSMYVPGKIVTWNAASSTSTDPRVVKRFLDTDRTSTNGVKGTIFVIHVRSGKDISQYSQYPDEREVLLLPNTQLRVCPRVGSGVKDLIAYAMRCDLSNVAIVELEEVSLMYWSDLQTVLLPEERERLQGVLKALRDAEAKLEWKSYCPPCYMDPVTRAGAVRWGRYPMCSVPWPTFLDEVRAVESSVGVWSVVLHRLKPSAVLESVKGFLPEVLRSLAPTLYVQASSENHLGLEWKSSIQHFTVPATLGIVEAVLARVGGVEVARLVQDDKAALHGLLRALLTMSRMPTPAEVQAALEPLRGSVDGALLCAASFVHVEPSRLPLLLDGVDEAERARLLGTRTVGGITSLHIASFGGAVDNVRVLLPSLVDVNDESDRSALYVAVQGGQFEVVDMLAREVPTQIDKSNANNTSCLYVACYNGYLDIARLFIRLRPSLLRVLNRGTTSVLHIACAYGHLEVARLLVEVDAGLLDVMKNDNESALFVGCQRGHLEIVRFLIGVKPWLLQCYKRGNVSPLLIACQCGHLEIVRYLIGVAPSQLDVYRSDGASPLYVSCEHGHVEVAQVLLCVRPQALHDKTASGTSAVEIAQRQGHEDIVKLLGAHADVTCS